MSLEERQVEKVVEELENLARLGSGKNNAMGSNQLFLKWTRK